jgi:hypothetical protein
VALASEALRTWLCEVFHVEGELPSLHIGRVGLSPSSPRSEGKTGERCSLGNENSPTLARTRGQLE